MGGERQAQVGPAAAVKPGATVGPPPAAPPPQVITPVPEMKQQVRFHENQGEVHFHVDAENLKVAVPSGEWFKAWEDLARFPGREWSFVDKQRGTLLTVKSGIISGTLDAYIEVTKIQAGNTFTELDKFTVG